MPAAKISPLHSNLQKHGITLPQPAKPAAHYLPVKSHAIGNNTLLFVSGQLPLKDTTLMQGIVGSTLTIDEAIQAARLCALHVLAQVNQACPPTSLATLTCLQLRGFVACDSQFTQQPKVIDAASQLITQLLEDNGCHARAAVGVSSLPLGACVEVEALFAYSAT
ncbi:MAG: RidA family protein [Alphaproteobacteria bacterium GM202ARS2]|nr:RidA family protein [Alphaproteobacteria bacterium GM202ARS2]